jgi:hypothetical protein
LTASFWNEQVRDNFAALSAAVPARSTITNQTTTVAGTAFQDTGLSVTITPSTTSSLIEVSFTVHVGANNSVAYQLNLVRNSTNIAQGATCTTASVLSSGDLDCHSMTFIDAPATTSATTYKLQWQRNTAGVTLYLNRRGDSTDIGPISYLQAREIIQ